MENQESVALKLAQNEDLDEVVALVRSLSSWLSTKGIRQWSASFPRKALEEEVSRGELFVLKSKTQVIGSVALGRDSGSLWNGEGANSLYLHRLAIARDRSGQELGKNIMKWAETEAKRQGMTSIRLVCDATNSFLQKYYASLGYESRGEILFDPWNMTFARFEKRME